MTIQLVSSPERSRPAGPTVPPGNTGRASWHRRANAVVLAWLVVAGAFLLIAAVPGHHLTDARWLALHALFVGAATTAIVVWSGHFAAALTRTATVSRRGGTARLVSLQVGIVLVLIAVPHGWNAMLDAGAVVLAGSILWHAAALTGMLRRAVAPRFGIIVRWYVAAACFLLAGGLAGVLMAEGAPGPVPMSRLLAAHVVLMLLGWVGMTVLATLITLWPTVLRTRMDARSDAAARRALQLCTLGVAEAAVGLLISARLVSVTGLLALAAGISVLLPPLLTAARQRRPHTGAAWFLVAALGWFGILLGRLVFASAVGGSDDFVAALDGIAPAAAVGFVGQVLLGALSGLLPAVLGGGPFAVRAAIARIETGWPFRLAALNTGLILAVTPGPPALRTTGWALVLIGAAAPFVAFASSLLLFPALNSRRTAVPATPPVVPPATGGMTPVKPPSERRAVLAGVAFGAVLLLIAVLVAVSGRGGSDGSTEAAATSTNVTASGTKTMAVTLDMMRIQPGVITVPSGTHLVLQVTNRDGMRHDLAVPSGKRTPMLSRGQSARLDVGVVTKALTLRCTVPGHAAAGMTMKVAVTGSASAPKATTENRSATAAFDPMAKPAASDPSRDPRLAPAPASRVHTVTITAQDKELTVAPGVRQMMWTFNGTVPGPVLHGRVGDTFDITFVNDATMGHSIDFHAGEVAPDQVMRTIEPGQRLHYRFRADHSGIWMYHCSTMPMTMHIGNGMYGAVVIDPPNLPPVDQEYVLVQSELYLGAQGGTGNPAAMAAGTPDAVVFNGESNQYDTHPLTAKPGQRVRIWVLNAGLSLPSSFHVVGTQFDTVFSEGAYLLQRGNADAGAAQVLALQPAQGGFVEFTVPGAGHYPIVSHRMADAARGAHGILLVR